MQKILQLHGVGGKPIFCPYHEMLILTMVGSAMMQKKKKDKQITTDECNELFSLFDAI